MRKRKEHNDNPCSAEQSKRPINIVQSNKFRYANNDDDIDVTASVFLYEKMFTLYEK